MRSRFFIRSHPRYHCSSLRLRSRHGGLARSQGTPITIVTFLETPVKLLMAAAVTCSAVALSCDKRDHEQ